MFLDTLKLDFILESQSVSKPEGALLHQYLGYMKCSCSIPSLHLFRLPKRIVYLITLDIYYVRTIMVACQQTPKHSV